MFHKRCPPKAWLPWRGGRVCGPCWSPVLCRRQKAFELLTGVTLPNRSCWEGGVLVYKHHCHFYFLYFALFLAFRSLMPISFWWWQCSVRCRLPFPHLGVRSPFLSRKWHRTLNWVKKNLLCIVSRLGLVVRRSAGKRKDAGWTPCFGSPFSSNIVIYGRIVTLPCTRVMKQ